MDEIKRKKMEICPNCGAKYNQDGCSAACTKFSTGEIVQDLLLPNYPKCKIIKIEYPDDTALVETIYLDSAYLGGLRYPWEIAKISNG